MQDINLNFKPSRQFMVLLSFVAVWSLAAVSSLSSNIGIKILLFSFILIYGARIFLRYGLLKNRHSILQLVVDSNGCSIRTNQEVLAVKLLGESTLTTWLSILRFSHLENKNKYSCLIFKDSIGSEAYRRLLVAIKLRGIKP